VPGSAKGMTTGESSQTQPAADEHPVALDGLGGVVGARGQEAAGASKVWGNKYLVAAKDEQRRPDLDPRFRGF